LVFGHFCPSANYLTSNFRANCCHGSSKYRSLRAQGHLSGVDVK
jgi:hypothetical protein